MNCRAEMYGVQIYSICSGDVRGNVLRGNVGEVSGENFIDSNRHSCTFKYRRRKPTDGDKYQVCSSVAQLWLDLRYLLLL